MKTGSVISFGPFVIDLRSLELKRDGVLVPLEPLPTRILARLAAEPGTLVERRELLELGWPHTPWVAEQALNTCIYQIRRALATGAPPLVELETLRGRGYRLTLPSQAGQPASTATHRRPLALIASAAASCAAVALWLVLAQQPASELPAETERILGQARYLARETQDIESALALLDAAREKLPQVAALHAEWGELNLQQGDRAAAALGAERALALDPRIATAHRTQGQLAMLRSDWNGAEAALERALALDENDTATLIAHAYLRTIERRFEDADARIRQALRIDPLSTTIYQDAGLIYLLMGRYENAARYCRVVLRFQPRSRWGTDCLFDVAVLAGRTAEAADWGRRLLELYDEAAPPDDLSPEDVMASVEAWRLERWIEAVNRGAYPFGLALAFAANGRTDEAIEALRAAAREPQLGLLAMAVDPRLATLRGYAAFQEVTHRLQLSGSEVSQAVSARRESG